MGLQFSGQSSSSQVEGYNRYTQTRTNYVLSDVGYSCCERRNEQNPFAIDRTKPNTCNTKRGTSGQLLLCKANYYKFEKRHNWKLLQYRVDFQPEIMAGNKLLRKYLIFTQKRLLGPYLFYRQNTVYLSRKLPQEITVVNTQDSEGNNYQLTFKHATVIGSETSECLQVLNMILRRAMEGLNLPSINRKLFDPDGQIDFPQYQLQIWPGYITSIRQHEVDVLLCAEIASKVMRKETVYDMLVYVRDRDNWQTAFNDLIWDLEVLTDYNNKTYRIAEARYDQSPADTFETTNGSTTFIEYYRRKYNINIRCATQPMLIVPELCRPTGLTDAQRNNWQLMRTIAEQTRMNCRKRMQALRRFNHRLKSTPASVDILEQWNFELAPEMIDVKARTLESETILFTNSVKEPADWQNAFRSKEMFLSVKLLNWCNLAPNYMIRNIDTFLRDLHSAAGGMKFVLEKPRIITMPNDRVHAYRYAFEDAVKHDPQLIMAFVRNNRADIYATIKEMGCVTNAIPTQVIVEKTLNSKNLLSIATKVAIQLNTKIGGIPWLVDIPTRGLMTIGIDIARDKANRIILWGALVATMDLKKVRTDKESFYSTVSQYRESAQYSAQLPVDIIKAVKCYQEVHNGLLPEKICIYRAGVGDRQIQFVYETEIQNIKIQLEKYYACYNRERLQDPKHLEAKLKLAFIVVSKRINTRIFTAQESNPPPGTIVDDTITLPERYDFYLVSQAVRQGTVSHTSYNDRLQKLTYKQCHLYYNWTGTVRVPAVCQYAQKLLFLMSQFLHQTPNSNVQKRLYFL